MSSVPYRPPFINLNINRHLQSPTMIYYHNLNKLPATALIEIIIYSSAVKSVYIYKQITLFAARHFISSEAHDFPTRAHFVARLFIFLRTQFFSVSVSRFSYARKFTSHARDAGIVNNRALLGHLRVYIN